MEALIRLLRQILRSEGRLPEAGQMRPRDLSGAGAHSGGISSSRETILILGSGSILKN